MKPKSWFAAGLMAALALAPGIPAQTSRPAQPRRLYVGHESGSYLGIAVVEIDAARAKALNLSEVRGVEIKTVEENSPAAKAGLKAGDVVLEYNGEHVEGTEQFVRMVRETPPERQVNLVVWRNGANVKLTATMGSRPRTMFRMPNGEEFEFHMPPIPPIPPMPPMPAMPDFPSGMMSWRSSMLGIDSEPLSSQLAEFFGVKQGVLVRSVTKDSAAEKAGLRAGDVITKVDATSVASPRDLTNALRAARSKHTFPLTIVRDKRETTLTVTVEDGSNLHGVRSVIAWSYGC